MKLREIYIEHGGAVVPVEVKSGTRGSLKSLQRYVDELGSKHAFVLSQRNIERIQETVFLPLYLASRIQS